MLLIIFLVNFMVELLSYNTQWQLVSYLVYIRQNMPIEYFDFHKNLFIQGLYYCTTNSDPCTINTNLGWKFFLHVERPYWAKFMPRGVSFPGQRMRVLTVWVRVIYKQEIVYLALQKYERIHSTSNFEIN